jgi:hypothetical protein
LLISSTEQRQQQLVCESCLQRQGRGRSHIMHEIANYERLLEELEKEEA